MWGIQVKINDNWEWLHPPNYKIPYKYLTKEEAELCSSYLTNKEVRVRKFSNDKRINK